MATIERLTRVALPAFPGENQSSDFVSLAAAVTAIGSSPSVLKIHTVQWPNGATTTVPSTLILEFVGNGSLNIANGQTVTIQSDNSNWPLRKIFFNASAGQGTVSFAGNKLTGYFFAAWWGVQDGVESTALLQTITDQLATDEIDATVELPPGELIIGGALQDTSFSNAQWVLPKRTNTLSLRIKGASPSRLIIFHSTAAAGGTVLKSTLSSGTGNVIGVRNVAEPEVNRTELNLYLEDITIQTVTNPTLTALDLRYVKRPMLRNVRVWTGEVNNDAPTEPTTSTSYGIRMPINFNPLEGNLESVTVLAFFNGVEAGELTYANNLTIMNCKNGLIFPEAAHPFLGGRILLLGCTHNLVFTGGVSTVYIEELDIERTGLAAGWYSTIDDVSDPSNFARGIIHYHLIVPFGVVSEQLIYAGGQGAAKYLHMRPIFKPTLSRYDTIEPLSGFNDPPNGHAITEINPRSPTSNNTKFAALIMGAEQSGLAHLVGSVYFINNLIAGDRRLAQIAVETQGQTNHGRLSFHTMLNGTLGERASIDRFGIFTMSGPLAQTEGSVLTISANAISPQASVHHVGGSGPLRTINLPTGWVSGAFYLIPDAAWPYDNVGNIVGSGTAVVGRIMIAVYSTSTTKWYMSY